MIIDEKDRAISRARYDTERTFDAAQREYRKALEVYARRGAEVRIQNWMEFTKGMADGADPDRVARADAMLLDRLADLVMQAYDDGFRAAQQVGR
jgi:hypothetical protein